MALAEPIPHRTAIAALPCWSEVEARSKIGLGKVAV